MPALLAFALPPFARMKAFFILLSPLENSVSILSAITTNNGYTISKWRFEYFFTCRQTKEKATTIEIVFLQ